MSSIALVKKLKHFSHQINVKIQYFIIISCYFSYFICKLIVLVDKPLPPELNLMVLHDFKYKVQTHEHSAPVKMMTITPKND